QVASSLIDPRHAGRVRTAAPGLIAGRPDWPRGVAPPMRAVRADLPSLVRTARGGTEQDVRLWAWLAYLRKADQVVFADPLPPGADERAPADPADLVWFYPGKWFGRPDLAAVPSVQLKWLRQAEQDFEYLALLRNRGEAVNTLWMSRLMTKPVEIGLGQIPDDVYALMTGTTDPKAWADARSLLGRMLDLYAGIPAGTEPDAEQTARIAEQRKPIEFDILEWSLPQERPALVARRAEWTFDGPADGAQWVRLNFGLDVYNAADVAPGENQMRWSAVGDGWRVAPQPAPIPPLHPYRVMATELEARVNLDRLGPRTRRPVEVELKVDSPTRPFTSRLTVSLPVAVSERREGRLAFDGRIDDWTEIDQIHDGPLTKMLSRPAVLGQRTERASTQTKLYTGWTTSNFFVAFGVDGVSPPADGRGKNFVEYQDRRAWGEDLCEVLIQPVYRDNSVGPLLHVVVKPNGSNWVERRLDPKRNADPWEPFEGTGTRYYADVGNGRWTGELSVPWKLLAHPQLELPRMLRFNFVQHRAAVGESASWAGPIDFGRDDALTGLLYVTLPMAGNPGDAVAAPGRSTGSVER
ncbi:MAG TPA: hypothetical protein VF796_06300, partial [Humisphaera sp.]